MQQSVYREHGAKVVLQEVGFQKSTKNKNICQQYVDWGMERLQSRQDGEL